MKAITQRTIELLSTAFWIAVLFASLTGLAAESVDVTGSLAFPRKNHTATPLMDGRVLVVGGENELGQIAAAELYDPALKLFSTVGQMGMARVGHAATLLPNGTVLITGGRNATGSLASAEIFDPASTTPFRSLASTMGAARVRHSSTLMVDGKVLIAGGDLSGTAEIFDPATETFSTSLIAMIEARAGQTATTLPENSVLLAGGGSRTVELFDVQTSGFLSWPAVLSEMRSGQSAISAPDSNIYFIGGEPFGTLEKFDLLSTTPGVSLSLGAPVSSATMLANGKVLVTGPVLATLFNPATSTFSPLANAGLLERSGQTMTELSADKHILVVGGVDANTALVAPAAIYSPAKIETDKQDYQPDETVVVYGSGWKPGENVDLYVVDDQGWLYDSTATADAAGLFTADPYFVVLMRHLDVTFDLTALGVQSGLQAKHTFTDSSAQVRRLGFLGTIPASFSVGLAAGPINVQTQNSAGNPEFPTGNTANSTLTILLTSSSASGRFSVDGGLNYLTSVSQTIDSSAPAGNFPSFLYRDTAAGNVVITATVTALGTGYNSPFGIGSTGTLSRTVNKANTTTTLVRTAGNAAAIYGDSQTFQATVVNSTPLSSGTPTGSVNFKDGATVIGTSTLDGSGVATFVTSSIAVGTNKSITAVYVADSNYNTSTSAAVLQTVTAKNLTITGAVAADKTYNGNATATVSFVSASLTGIANSEAVTINSSGYSASFSDKNAGNGKSITVTGVTLGGAGAANYTVSQPTGLTANITPKNLTVTGSVAINKVYSGDTVATVNFGGATLVGVVNPDVVTIDTSSYVASFSDKNVGNGKTVTVTGVTLGGGGAANYSISQPTGLTANISALHITGAFTASDKIYDGGVAASVLTRSTMGDVGGVSLIGGAATFVNKNVGNGKTVTLAGGTLSGADSANYILDSVATTTASITALHITGAFVASDKVYDGNPSASVVTRSTVGDIGGVTLTGGTASFADKNVANAKLVTLTGATLSGADAANYVLDSVATTTANITALHITGSFTASDKSYDGNVSAIVLTRSTVGDVGGVSLTGGTASFADKNVGSGKAVTLAGATLSGVDAANYVLDSVATTTANITALHITGTFTASNKVYDGNASATVLARMTVGGVGGVTLTGGTASFADKNVGSGKTVTLAGATLSGVDSANYVLDSVATTTANVTVRHITGAFTASNKVYDGNTSATVLTRSTASDVGGVMLTGGTATFADKNVGNGKIVTLAGATLSGADVANYVLDSVDTTLANITALHITGNFTAANKVYDSTTVATVLTYSTVGDIGGVNLTGGTGSFADKDVGSDKIVTLVGGSLIGVDAANYILDSVATTTANITALHITGAFTASNKVYDGTTTAMVSGRSTVGDVGGVSLTGGTAAFADKNIGTGKMVTLTGAILSGVDVGNYVLDSVATTVADITALHITGTFTAGSKVYDGNTSATVLTRSTVGDVGGVSLTGGTATFENKNVGTGKIVTLAGAGLSGVDVGNYVLDTVATTTANITALHITGTFTASSKIYDGTISATVTMRSVVGDVGGVSLTAGTATFADKHVGTGKVVTLVGASLGGVDAANYILDSVATATANISILSITISAASDTKPYDGNTSSSGMPIFTTLMTGDTKTASQVFDSKNVGSRTLSVSAYSITDGNGGNNYTVTLATATGSITAKNLTIIGAVAADKVYDGNTTATVSFTAASLVGVVSPDVVTINSASYTATFADALVGTAKPVTVTGVTLGGAGAANYTVSQPSGLTASIKEYSWAGFFQPVDNLPVVNRANSGSAIPVKFSLGGNKGMAIMAAGYPAIALIPTSDTAPISVIEQTVTAGGSSLSYDAGSNQYVYVWKTEKAWAGKSYRLVVKLADGSTHYADFNFAK
ncbi:MAG: YDG domain-containing protein [Opitutus sp.]